jgi:DNA-binding NarL/FixJ family response regulator
MRSGVRALVEEMPGVVVVGEAADGAEALRRMREVRPDVALVDISMPRLNGLEVVARASAEHQRVRIVILSMHADQEYVERALRAGASGYLLKTAEQWELKEALCSVARGQIWISPAIARTVVDALARADRPQEAFQLLSPRQREILQLIAEGRSTKEIAQLLDVTVKTVETHRAELMERLGIRGIASLVRYAVRMGVVIPDA